MSNQHPVALLHDHHTHPLFYSAFLRAIDFSDVSELDHAVDLIRGSNSSPIVLGHSWKDNFFSLEPTILERLPPCAIFNISLHQLAINSAAMKLLSEKLGGEIGRLLDRDWYERNLQSVLNWFALLNASSESLVQFYDFLEGVGIGSAEEMLLVDGVEIDWYEQAGLTDRTRFWADPCTYAKLKDSHKRAVSGIKLFTDGAFGARTAAISENYLGESDNRGMLLYSDDELAKVVVDAAATGLSLAVHAIGDRAIEQIIGVVQQTNVVQTIPQIRIEHAQVITLQQALRSKELGIDLSMQPNFNGDSVSYRDRLPPKFVDGNNPFRMLIDEVGFVPGEDLIFGSDGMPHGIQFAAEQATKPSVEGQRLSMEELIAGYSG